MPNILIRDLSQEAIDRIDTAAADLGLSRNEYLRRKFEEGTGSTSQRTVTPEDWQRSAENLWHHRDFDVHQCLEYPFWRAVIVIHCVASARPG